MAIDAIFPNVFQTVVRKIRTRRSNGVAARSTAKSRRRFSFILAQGDANFEGATLEKRVFFRFFSNLGANERKRPAKRAFVGASRSSNGERRRGVGGG